MKNIQRFFAFILVVLTVVPANAQSDKEALRNLQVDVVYLASDLLEGRETGTQGEALALDYIASRFEELGLEPAGTDGWAQSFEYTYSDNPHAAPGSGEARVGHNVVGFLDNGANQTVVVGAHFDHLGHGIFGSRQPNEPGIHNGADDNASGVAGMLEIARQLKASSAKNNNYLFIGFSGEELGLYGSKAFVRDPDVDLADFNYMINLDMVGRLNEEKVLAVNGTGTSPSWDAVLDAAAERAGLDIKKHESGVGASDHTSFYLEEIPVLHMFTGQHEEYHKASDDSELINYQGIYDVASYVVDIIESVDGSGELAYAKTKDEQQRASTFKVSLGIMPDYVSDGEGVRVDAVMDDRPGAVAGLEKGDVIIKLGDVDVVDINAYMQALGKFDEGDKTMIVVKRGEETLTKEVVF